jgi:hypothetical protein
MMTALLLSVSLLASILHDDESLALGKARAFRNVAASANGTYQNSYIPVFELRATDHTPKYYHFIFGDGGVVVRRSDHLIIGFSFSPPDAAAPVLDSWDTQNAIGDSAAQALAGQYIVASGCTQLYTLKHFERDLHAIIHVAYSMTHLPTYSDVLYHPDYKVSTLVEYNTGRLLLLVRDADLPNPPASFEITVTREAALYNFAMHVLSSYGVSNINIETSELVIWNPKQKHINHESNNLPQPVLDLIGTNGSVLVYCFLGVQPGLVSEGKQAISSFEGYIDPSTGTVWSVKQYHPFGGGTAGPLRWDLGVGATTVSNGKQTIEVKDADVDQVSAPRTFTPSSKIVLRRAKVVIVIEYDRASGLIRTSQNGMHSYGKPSDNLKRALDQLTR